MNDTATRQKTNYSVFNFYHMQNCGCWSCNTVHMNFVTVSQGHEYSKKNKKKTADVALNKNNTTLERVSSDRSIASMVAQGQK